MGTGQQAVRDCAPVKKTDRMSPVSAWLPGSLHREVGSKLGTAASLAGEGKNQRTAELAGLDSGEKGDVQKAGLRSLLGRSLGVLG